MEIVCTATMDNNSQVNELCEKIEKLGGKPSVSGVIVTVEYRGRKSHAEKIIELFEVYSRHGIFTIH